MHGWCEFGQNTFSGFEARTKSLGTPVFLYDYINMFQRNISEGWVVYQSLENSKTNYYTNVIKTSGIVFVNNLKQIFGFL